MVYNANEETKSVNAGYLNSREDTFLISLPTGIVSSAEVLLENVQTKAFLITHITNILELSMFVKKYINAKIAIEVIKQCLTLQCMARECILFTVGLEADVRKSVDAVELRPHSEPSIKGQLCEDRPKLRADEDYPGRSSFEEEGVWTGLLPAECLKVGSAGKYDANLDVSQGQKRHKKKPPNELLGRRGDYGL